MKLTPLTPTVFAAVSFVLTLCAACPALAVDPQPLYTQSLAATCANCHGTQGKGVADGSVPRLAGLKAEYV